MKILLIQPPHISDGIARMPDSFPLGLAYLATVLSKEHDIDVLDIWGNELDKEEVVEKIKEISHGIIGVTAMATQYAYIKWLCSEIKKYHPDKKIVLGGILATNSMDIVLKNTSVDICVVGEGEITFPDLLWNLDNLEKVDGIAFKKGNEIIKTKPREYIKDLDTIPFPNWDMFPVEKYTNRSLYRADGRKANIIAGRGCPYNCTFCSKSFKGTRFRSVDNIVEEIKLLKSKYKIETIYFDDELVVVNKKRVYELCDKIKPLGVKWACQGRVNVVDLPLLKKMKESGCIRVGYGIESGSQKILDIMNKQVKVDQALQAVLWTQRIGIPIAQQMMFGMVGETRETLKETVEFCKKAHLAVSLSPTTPLPNTWLYDYAMKKGLIKDEEKFLEGLPGTFKLYVNVTDFSDDEYVGLKKEKEDEILKNYIAYRRKHPLILWKDYSHKFRRVYWYIKDFGLKRFIKSFINVIKNDKGLLFSKEEV